MAWHVMFWDDSGHAILFSSNNCLREKMKISVPGRQRKLIAIHWCAFCSIIQLCNTQILRITNCSSAGLFSLLVLVRPSDPSDRLRAPKLGVFRQPCLMNDAVRVQTGGAEIGRCHWSCWSISEQTKAPFTPSAYIVACKCGHTNTHGFMHMQIAKLRAGGHVSSWFRQR